MYGLDVKRSAGAIQEDEYNVPHTMYGCNKLYCEKLGMYYSHYNGQRHLDAQPPVMLDFRALRFPGLISAHTLPSGGTSDYGPEMLHAAAQGKPYVCFVRADTKISFMAMPDAIKSLLMLADVPREKLNHVVYNVAAFALTAGEFHDRALKAFPGAQISFEPEPAPPGYRRFMARRCGRFPGPRRMGLAARLRYRCILRSIFSAGNQKEI